MSSFPLTITITYASLENKKASSDTYVFSSSNNNLSSANFLYYNTKIMAVNPISV